MLPRLMATFASHGLSLIRVDQRPLWWLGRETRETGNWGLVSDRGRS